MQEKNKIACKMAKVFPVKNFSDINLTQVNGTCTSQGRAGPTHVTTREGQV